MTEKEMAEEYANNNVPTDTFGYRSLDDVHYDIRQAFLAGVKAGRPQWHKIVDGDYPHCEKGNYSINVLTDTENIAYYNYDFGCWVAEPTSVEIDPPIAWCEIPKFE